VDSCQAKVPVTRGLLLLCGEPAEAMHVYRCPCGHQRQGATCPAHQPAPGTVGCAQCLSAGHECPMTAELVPGG
jgi:hypothetical protein